MNLIKKATGVYIAPGPIATIGRTELDYLRMELANNARGRVRINLHPDNADTLHEMFIAIRPDSYIRPHKHLEKSEAFHIVYGEVDVVLFDDDGDIAQIVPLAAGSTSNAFYYRMSRPFFHTLMIKSDLLLVHEITNGPFTGDSTMYAEFAPAEDADAGVIDTWLTKLSASARQVL